MADNADDSQHYGSAHSHSDQGWITNFNLETATKDLIAEYIEERIRSYKGKEEWEDEQWLSFKEDFINFEEKHFTGPTEAVKNLRDFLRNRGVWIAKEGKAIA